jgi:hypothetical protein
MKMSIPLSSEKEPGDDVKLSPQLWSILYERVRMYMRHGVYSL